MPVLVAGETCVRVVRPTNDPAWRCVIELRPGVELLADAQYAGSYTLLVDGTEQSYVDLDDPTRLDFDYVQRIADALDLVAPPGERIRIVHVGGALMTVPRYVAHTRPQSAQLVLEPDAELTDFVREHVPLPKRSGIKVRPVDGRSGLAALRDDYADVVVVDAFAGPQVPPELTTVEYFTDVARVLDSGGTLMINITDKGISLYARRVLAAAEAVFAQLLLSAEPATLKGRRFGNVIILGSAAPLPVADLTRRAAGSAFPYRLVHGDALTRLRGSARPFVDGDAQPSPPPPGGRAHFS